MAKLTDDEVKMAEIFRKYLEARNLAYFPVLFGLYTILTALSCGIFVLTAIIRLIWQFNFWPYVYIIATMVIIWFAIRIWFNIWVDHRATEMKEDINNQKF